MNGSARVFGLQQLVTLLVMSGAAGSGCDLYDNNSADAGTGGSSNGSGTVLAATCTSTFTDCGGDVTGTWKVTSICAESNPVDAVNQQNAAKYPDCTGFCSAVNTTATGSVSYSSQSMSSNLAFRTVESLSLTPACFAEYAGTTASESTCQSLAYDPSGASNSSCSLVLSNCNCQYDKTTKDNASTYAVSGTEIVEYDLNTLSQQSFKYCVSGTTMTQRRIMTPGINYQVQFTRQ